MSTKNRANKHRRSRDHAKSRHRGQSAAADRSLRNQWTVRAFRFDLPTSPAYVEFTFPSEGGVQNQVHMLNSELSHRAKVLDQVNNYVPLFPKNVGSKDDDRFEFLTKLVESRGPIEVLPSRTGFMNKETFATHREILHADGTRGPFSHLLTPEGHAFVDLKGNADGTQKYVLALATKSTYLAFGLGAALAAPLPSYLRLFRNDDEDASNHLTETAVFNFSGPSSSGKTSVLRAAMSLAGSPERAGTLDLSRRGLAELAHSCNDLLTALDDTEKSDDGSGALVKTLKAVVHMVPGGRSKIISRGADQFPALRWSTLTLCSSPRPIPDLAAEQRWTMSAGDKVRIFDISAPGPEKGGIFDRIPGSRRKRPLRSVDLIAKLENGYLNHCGHVLPQWVMYLMKNDRSARIIKYMNEFVDHVGANKQGWETRFARKFALVYAAMKLGIKAGILPWPESLPLKVAKKCYRKARDSAKTADERVADARITLRQLISETGRVVNVRRDANRSIKIPDRCIALSFTKDGRTKIGVFDDALLTILGSRKAKKAFTNQLVNDGLVSKGHGHAGTAQEWISIKRNSKIVDRPHLWVLDSKRLARFLKGTAVPTPK